jgi:hypothetical protein
MLYLLLESIYIYGKIDETIEILLYTSSDFMNIIKQSYLYNENIKFEINNNYNNIDTSYKSRLDLFNLLSISKYNKILYLNTDILIKDDINKVFNIIEDDILYVLEEGTIDCNTDYWGKTLFSNEINKYVDKTAFTSGILLFNNCEKIKNLFYQIQQDINERPYNFICYDQPYIVYNAFKYNLYNNKILKSFVVNNDNNIHSNMVIHHFPGGPGIYEDKIESMTLFLNNLNEYTNNFKNNITNDIKIQPKKNTIFPLTGLCVSYNYFDTLKFMLPINYLHFEQIYLITQIDDIITIEFCKQFSNVTVLFYNFKNNNKVFDKYGAIKYAQQIMYKKYPNNWYLIIDSDIILPNNFIDILNKDLNPECIYGATRNNLLKSSELLYKTDILSNKKNINFIFNNILHVKYKPPSILGCFQLYKKKCYQNANFNNAGHGDYDFGYKNFKLFCNLENILYFHLGPSQKNWNGKVEYFIDDINISLNDIYYNCNIKCKNIYYNELCKPIEFNNKLFNIYDDIWTCSDEMRDDIAKFFYDKKNLQITEIGSYKGYTTKVLSKIFSKVYAIDNNVEFMNFNKTYNKDNSNIEYIILDIYKDNWNILPNYIDVVFIDADHNFDGCKKDIINSINQFKNLQYIIFDDYGVWQDVNYIINKLLMLKILIFEKFIGINNVPGPNGIVKNINEGIICSINKNINVEYINFCLTVLPPPSTPNIVSVIQKRVTNKKSISPPSTPNIVSVIQKRVTNKKSISLRILNNSKIRSKFN